MSQRGPMLINLPPPPSDPTTPNEQGPGTPNSATTSLSTLSVIAIKDGLVGHGGRGGAQSVNTLEAERADRISRLAGLERVATVRATPSGHLIPGAGPQAYQQYFDGSVPQFRERSTVGSASATGSIGGRTTWASESFDDPDKMSEDQDEVSSVSGFSDEDKASLVGFGEGANSTVSGPVSTSNARILAARQMAGNPTGSRSGFTASNSGQSTPMSGILQTGTAAGAAGATDAKAPDSTNHDTNMVDMMTSQPTPSQSRTGGSRFSGVGAEMAETIMRDRLNESDSARRLMGTPDSQNLGKFAFERED